MSARAAPLARPRRPASLMRLIVPVVTLGAIFAVALPRLAHAQEESAMSPAPKAATTISVTFEPSRMDGIPNYLAARLTSGNGSAVVGKTVTFRRTADVFGGRTVTIGRASTDNSGTARIPVVPREETYRVVASFGGSDALESATVEDDLVFPAELVIIPEEVPRGGLVDPQLRPLADVMPLAIGAAVIVVWIVILGLTVVTLVRIRSTRRSDERASGPLSAEAPGTESGTQRG